MSWTTAVSQDRLWPSGDGKTLYFADSPTGNLYAFDYDIETGTISNRRVFYQVDEGEGVPDGHAVDEEGHIWQAIYGAGKVVRISPEGTIVTEILLPTRCPTCPCFVGEDLYITTAKEEQPEKYPEVSGVVRKLIQMPCGREGRANSSLQVRQRRRLRRHLIHRKAEIGTRAYYNIQLRWGFLMELGFISTISYAYAHFRLSQAMDVCLSYQ